MSISQIQRLLQPTFIPRKFTCKIKPKGVIVYDGYLQYQVRIDSLQCQCYQSRCPHLIYVLELLGLNPMSVTYVLALPELRSYLSDLIKPPAINSLDYNTLILDFLQSHFCEDECGICLGTLSQKDKPLDLEVCTTCNKWVHVGCLNRWIRKNHNKEVNCIYCRSETK